MLVNPASYNNYGEEVMSTRRSVLIRSLGVCAAAALLVGHSLPAAAAADASAVAANKAVAQRYLEALGTSKFAEVSKQTQAADYKLVRHEFENLKFNADDPKLSKAMQPDAVAIADRSNTITRILGQGDTVAATIRIKGTHKGNLYGIPATGKPIEIGGSLGRAESTGRGVVYTTVHAKNYLASKGRGSARVDSSTTVAVHG